MTSLHFRCKAAESKSLTLESMLIQEREKAMELEREGRVWAEAVELLQGACGTAQEKYVLLEEQQTELAKMAAEAEDKCRGLSAELTKSCSAEEENRCASSCPAARAPPPLLADLHRQQPLRRGGSNWRTLRTFVSHRFLGRSALEAASSKNDELLEKVAELELLLETAKATTSGINSV